MGGALGYELSLAQDGHLIGQFPDELKVVTCQQFGERQGRYKRHKLLPSLRVKPIGWVVQHEQTAVQRQHGGQSYPFALSKTQMVRRSLFIIGHPNRRKGPLGAPQRLLGVFQIVERPEGDVFQHCRHKKLVGWILEQQSDQPARLGDMSFIYRQAEHFEPPFGLEHAVQAFEQGGLPRAVRTYEGQGTPFFQTESYPSQGLVACGISVGQVLNSQG